MRLPLLQFNRSNSSSSNSSNKSNNSRVSHLSLFPFLYLKEFKVIKEGEEEEGEGCCSWAI